MEYVAILWIILTLCLLILLFSTEVNVKIEITGSRKISPITNPELTEVRIRVTNIGHTYLKPSTKIYINDQKIELGKYLAPGDTFETTILLNCLNECKIENVKIEEDIDLFNSIKYVILNLGGILASKFLLQIQ